MSLPFTVDRCSSTVYTGDVPDATAPRLFAICPLPGCATLVADPRQPCPGCREAFGPFLQPAREPVAVEDFLSAQAASDQRVAALYATRALQLPTSTAAVGEWRRNQICWVCEERRSCKPDPDRTDRLICRACLAIDPASTIPPE